MTTLDQALSQVRTAEVRWRQTLAQHRLAPPDADFANRLADQAEACRHAQNAYAKVAAIRGLVLEPLPSRHREPPYELRPDSGRTGPEMLWEQYDRAFRALTDALEGTSLEELSNAFGGLADALDALAEANRRAIAGQGEPHEAATG